MKTIFGQRTTDFIINICKAIFNHTLPLQHFAAKLCDFTDIAFVVIQQLLHFAIAVCCCQSKFASPNKHTKQLHKGQLYRLVLSKV